MTSDLLFLCGYYISDRKPAVERAGAEGVTPPPPPTISLTPS
jgi:hypothetical protein